jgi:putative membrane protein
MKRAADFFTPEERDRISKAVLEAEKQTSGEIVPVVATASAHYHRAEDVGGLLFSLAALTLSWLYFQRVLPAHGDWEHGYKLTLGLGPILLILVAGFITGVGITSRVAWLRRLLATRREMRREVERAAQAAFGRFRIGRAARGTGVVLYVSLFERMVCVLGDEVIGAKLDQRIWDEIHSTVASGLRHGHPSETFCQAIAQCGQLLGQHFPRHPSQTHDLSNQLRIID